MKSQNSKLITISIAALAFTAKLDGTISFLQRVFKIPVSAIPIIITVLEVVGVLSVAAFLFILFFQNQNSTKQIVLLDSEVKKTQNELNDFKNNFEAYRTRVGETISRNGIE
ncbi:MAG TPA: hypothetical protein VHZ50_08875, partial [Puia sp.]|nr:hypothetical protein [Puia sp.]